jgi:drug/metabolite transporter (DMT)-like permease
MSTKLLLSYLALGVGTLALSFAAMFIRWAQAPGTVTGFYRLFLSTLFLFPFFIIRCNNTSRHFKWFTLLPPILSGMCMAINFALWNTSLFHTTVANAAMLGNITPLWVCIAAWWLLRERLNKHFWIGLLTLILGIILILSGGSVLHARLGFGDLLAACSSIFSAAYILITQWGRQYLDSLTYVWINGASASLWMFVIILVLKYPLAGFSKRTWMVFVSAAIITQLMGYLAISFSLGNLSASIVSPTLNLQPVLAIIWAIPLLNEIPTVIQIFGCLLAVGGVYLINNTYQQKTTFGS